MLGLKSKKFEKGMIPLLEERKQWKFDISAKNYECFINKNSQKNGKKKQIKNKGHFLNLHKSNSKQKVSHEKIISQNEKSKQHHKTSLGKSHTENFGDKIPQEIPKECRKKDVSNSPDLLKSSMNEVILKIEAEGIKSKWDEQENRKIEYSKLQDCETPVSEEDRRIWLNQNCLSVISETQKSFVSTEQTIFSGRTGSIYNVNPIYNVNTSYGYFENVYCNRLSLNNSFNQYSQSNPYLEYCNQTEEEQQFETYVKKVFEINHANIIKDGRTTVMIKNIPNKYSLKLLSEEIDEKHSNFYDFLYMPCDFNNNCNVGYAFINFTKPEYLYAFYREFNQRKWLKFRSQKICILAYARLQGRDSLIDHFHNSKVLNQKQKRYRPIIRDLSKIEALLEKQRGQK